MTNTIYYSDNLKVLREHIPSESVDAENSFGAMLRKEFYCHLQDKGDSWYLISITED